MNAYRHFEFMSILLTVPAGEEASGKPQTESIRRFGFVFTSPFLHRPDGCQVGERITLASRMCSWFLRVSMLSVLVLAGSNYTQGEGLNGVSPEATYTVDEKDPGVLALGSAITQLLETQDVAAFVHKVSPSLDDWNELVPSEENRQSILGKNIQRTPQSQEQRLTSSARRVLEIANRLGVTKSQIRFSIKAMTVLKAGIRTYSLEDGNKLEMARLDSLQVVLAAEPMQGNAKTEQGSGDYILSVGKVLKFPAGWRMEQGIRWLSVPSNLLDEASRHDLALINQISSDPPWLPFDGLRAEGAPLTDRDDPALRHLGNCVIDLLQHRDVPAFVRASTPSRKPLEEYLAVTAAWHLSESQVERAYQQMNTTVATAAASLLTPLDRSGIDLSDAQITVKQVIANNPWTTQFGSLEGVKSPLILVTLAVQSTHTSKSGAPLSGDYTLAIQKTSRIDGGWGLTSATNDTLRWHQLPPGVLNTEEISALEFENYVAKNGTLPPGTAAPDLDLVRLPDKTRFKLSSLHGKILILEFWATWCHPCQEPMAKLQTLAAQNPQWKERVEIVTVNLNTTPQEASEHIAKQGWEMTQNTWGGSGEMNSNSARAFRVAGIPTTYVLDGNGKILAAGHPSEMDLAGLVNEALR